MELVRRYSNRPDLQERLTEARSRARQRGEREPESQANSATGRAPSVWRVRDRLTDDDVLRLIAEFLAGTSKRELAAQYELSLGSVKNLLRKHGARRANQS